MPNTLLLGTWKLKQWDTSLNLLKWLESKTLTTPDAEEEVEQ